MARKVIGIDFGSSQSSISMMTIGSSVAPELLRVGGGKNGMTIPTRMAIGINDGLVKAIGNEVRSYEKSSEAAGVKFVRDFKRYLGDPAAANSEEDSVRNANDYCRYTIKHLADIVRKHENIQTDQGDVLDPKEYVTCIAHPATWTDAQIAQLKAFAKDAGLPADSEEGVYTISEPEAAMHALRVKDSANFRFGDHPEHFMVIDFGGGTLDICIVKTGILGRNPRIVKESCTGDPFLGGKDFDDILEHLFFRQNSSLARKEMDHWELSELREKLKEAKEMFSLNFAKGNNKPAIPIDIPSGKFNFEISKEQFESLVKAKGYYDKIKQSIRKSMEAAGIDVPDITNVILTGGSSQWFFMENLVAQSLDLFGDKVVMSEDPYFDVATGCSVSIGRTDEPEMRPGVWIKWRLQGEKDWEKPKCLLLPARINLTKETQSQYIGSLLATQYVVPYRIEISWWSGVSEDELEQSQKDKNAVIEFYARSNSPILDALRGVSCAVRRKSYTPMKDEYQIYIQYQEDELGGKSYHFEILDVAAAKYEQALHSQGAEAVASMSRGHREEGDILPGYLSERSLLGFKGRKMVKL